MPTNIQKDIDFSSVVLLVSYHSLVTSLAKLANPAKNSLVLPILLVVTDVPGRMNSSYSFIFHELY